jgi:colanic acid/amylovoran biosynthesis glycosyltransferase
MLKIACLANEFPATVEPYVVDEIKELQRRGVAVIAGSVIRGCRTAEKADIVLRPAGLVVSLRALWLCIWRYRKIAKLVSRVFFGGHEGPIRRAKALLHTFLGGCYAVRLETEQVHHIHVHHGFSASWIAMVAARLLGVNFSVTLYGSDLLLHRAYMDVKLENCDFCLTISEYNRRFILTHYPWIDADKVVMARLGVDIPETVGPTTLADQGGDKSFLIATVGRLHPVKNQAFLIEACAELRNRGVEFHCEIAGDGPERRRMETLIQKLRLESRVTLLGFISQEEIVALYERANVFVLTSLSEGIPLVVMEAMARGKVVLAPAITGIPELVIPGRTGFLYEPGSIHDFLRQVLTIYSAHIGTLGTGQTDRHRDGFETPDYTSGGRTPLPMGGTNPLDWVRHAARAHVRHNFNREKNLQVVTERFLQRVHPPAAEDLPHASSVLQQI